MPKAWPASLSAPMAPSLLQLYLNSHEGCGSRGAVDGMVGRMLGLGWDEYEAFRVVEGLQFIIGKWSRRQAVDCGSDAHLGGNGARASTSQTDQTAAVLAHLSHPTVPAHEAPDLEHAQAS